MVSKKIILGSAILVLIILAILFYYFIFYSEVIEARLHAESGEIRVNGVIVKGDVILKEKDVVETFGGLASLILYESVIVSLDLNTKISVAELKLKHPKIEQEKGVSWNKFTKLSGVEGYSVKFGNSIASVRDTFFEVSKEKIMTEEGRVEYVIDGKSFSVGEKEVVEKKQEEIRKRAMTGEELERMRQSKKRAIEELKYLRKLEIEKNKFVLEIIKKKYSLTDEDIEKSIENIDKGIIDIEDLEKKSPVEIKSLRKIVELTKLIIEENKKFS